MLTYEFDRFMTFLFFLALALIVVVYYVGAKTDAQTFFSGVQGLGNVFTGRPTGGGSFGSYPTGG